MQCFECFEGGVERDAIALCHHCSAALCAHHAFVVPDPVTAMEPLFKTVVLPKRARVMLCGTCKQALAQTRAVAGSHIADHGVTEDEEKADSVLVHR